jgi:hypothetical protein
VVLVVEGFGTWGNPKQQDFFFKLPKILSALQSENGELGVVLPQDVMLRDKIYRAVTLALAQQKCRTAQVRAPRFLLEVARCACTTSNSELLRRR